MNPEINNSSDMQILFHPQYGLNEKTRHIEARPGRARILGLDLGWIDANEGEATPDFVRRMHTVKAGGKLTENMTADELEAAQLLADRQLNEAMGFLPVKSENPTILKPVPG